MTLLDAIRSLLHERDIVFREVHHEPTLTSQDAARVRGEELKNGGKALLMKVDSGFALFVLPADRRVHSAAIRRELAAKKIRFASREELSELTANEDRAGLEPGSVPPSENRSCRFRSIWTRPSETIKGSHSMPDHSPIRSRWPSTIICWSPLRVAFSSSASQADASPRSSSVPTGLR